MSAARNFSAPDLVPLQLTQASNGRIPLATQVRGMHFRGYRPGLGRSWRWHSWEDDGAAFGRFALVGDHLFEPVPLAVDTVDAPTLGQVGCHFPSITGELPGGRGDRLLAEDESYRSPFG